MAVDPEGAEFDDACAVIALGAGDTLRDVLDGGGGEHASIIHTPVAPTGPVAPAGPVAPVAPVVPAAAASVLRFSHVSFFSLPVASTSGTTSVLTGEVLDSAAVVRASTGLR